MSPNEEFAVALLAIAGRVGGCRLLSAECRPAWGDIKSFEERASSGERALVALALEAWSARSGIASALISVDDGLCGEVLRALVDAFGATGEGEQP